MKREELEQIMDAAKLASRQNLSPEHVGQLVFASKAHLKLFNLLDPATVHELCHGYDMWMQERGKILDACFLTGKW